MIPQGAPEFADAKIRSTANTFRYLKNANAHTHTTHTTKKSIRSIDKYGTWSEDTHCVCIRILLRTHLSHLSL